MDARDRWAALDRVLEASQRVLIASHLFPDGDAIGSEVALALHLRARGKKVLVLNETPAPERYRFLTRFHRVWSRAEHDFPRQTDLVVCLDVSSWDYMGRLGEEIRASNAQIVSIDHHHLRERFGHLDVNYESACSTGEVLYRFFRDTGRPITPPMAEAVYTSILFDTGGLRLGNTCNETIEIASELMRLGVDHRRVCAELFERDSWNKMDLWRLALGTLRLEAEGRLAWLAIPEDLYKLTGTRFADADGILDTLLSLQELELAVLFRETSDPGVKTTFRSKGRHDVGALAESFGGGGRATASGVLLSGSLHDSIDLVLPKVRALLAPAASARRARARALALPVIPPVPASRPRVARRARAAPGAARVVGA